MTDLGNGRYVILSRIAAGGMGEVWRGTDTSLGRDVAIKLLRPEVADDEKFRARFASEAKHAASLHDPRIATVFDYGDDVDPATGRHTTYLVMELVDGRPLSQLLTTPIAPDRAADLVAQAAEGLAVAHAAGIIHRDVKPANFLVTPGGRVKITDFGIARARGAASITDTGTIMGTAHYVAPEVAEGQEATVSSDIYSLGVVLYEALSATLPFGGETPLAVAMAHLRDQPRPLPSSVPAPLRSLVESALAKDPAQRPPDATAFAVALRRATGPDAVPATPMAAEPPATEVLAVQPPAPAPMFDEGVEHGRSRRIGWFPIAAAVLAVLLIGGVAYALVTAGDGSGEQDPASPAAAGAKKTQQNSPQTTPTTTPPDTTTPTTTPPTTTPPDTTTPSPEGIEVNPDDYIGLKDKDAEHQLTDLGLEVTTEETSGGEKHIVADITPTGTLQKGETVTLIIYTGDKSGPGGGED